MNLSVIQSDIAAQRAKEEKLYVLSTTQVAEYFQCSYCTAWLWMSTGIIPSFRGGKAGYRWFTHAYVIDTIERKAREAIGNGYNKKDFPRIAYKYERNKKY